MHGLPQDPHSLFDVPHERRTRTSDVILALAEQASQSTITLRSLTQRFGDRTFGLFLVLMAIFSIVPFVSLFAGLIIIVLGLQMVAGRRRAWLPDWILDRAMPAAAVKKALLTFEPKVRSIERYIRPRWRFTEAPIVDRLNGSIVAVLGVIIAIPVPLANLAPALVVIFMGLGLLERDGLVQMVALLLGLLAMTTMGYWLFIH